MEIVGVGDVDAVLVSKKSYRVSRICDVVSDRVSRLSRFDVGVKLLDVHDGDSLEDGDVERGYLKGRCHCSLVKTGRKL